MICKQCRDYTSMTLATLTNGKIGYLCNECGGEK